MEYNFLYSKSDDKIFIKLIGNIKYNYSNNFSNFIDTIFTKNQNEDIIIDLTKTKYIDSTNLGLLAKIARLQKRNNGKKVTIISDQTNINDILESMGFDMVFILIKSLKNNGTTYEEIAKIDNLNDRETAQLMLDAHKELSNVNHQNKQIFKDVVTFLQKDLES